MRVKPAAKRRPKAKTQARGPGKSKHPASSPKANDKQELAKRVWLVPTPFAKRPPAPTLTLEPNPSGSGPSIVKIKPVVEPVASAPTLPSGESLDQKEWIVPLMEQLDLQNPGAEFCHLAGANVKVELFRTSTMQQCLITKKPLHTGGPGKTTVLSIPQTLTVIKDDAAQLKILHVTLLGNSTLAGVLKHPTAIASRDDTKSSVVLLVCLQNFVPPPIWKQVIEGGSLQMGHKWFRMRGLDAQKIGIWGERLSLPNSAGQQEMIPNARVEASGLDQVRRHSGKDHLVVRPIGLEDMGPHIIELPLTKAGPEAIAAASQRAQLIGEGHLGVAAFLSGVVGIYVDPNRYGILSGILLGPDAIAAATQAQGTLLYFVHGFLMKHGLKDAENITQQFGWVTQAITSQDRAGLRMWKVRASNPCTIEDPVVEYDGSVVRLKISTTPPFRKAIQTSRPNRQREKKAIPWAKGWGGVEEDAAWVKAHANATSGAAGSPHTAAPTVTPAAQPPPAPPPPAQTSQHTDKDATIAAMQAQLSQLTAQLSAMMVGNSGSSASSQISEERARGQEMAKGMELG